VKQTARAGGNTGTIEMTNHSDPGKSVHGIRRLGAVLEALFVTFLWSTSYVLMKLGLKNIPPLTFAGLRYSLAFLCLLPLALRPATRQALPSLSRTAWLGLIGLGMMFYAITQGAQFVGLARLPAVTVTLCFSFTPVLVALTGIVTLNERPTRLQWGGVIMFLAGAVTYFYPVAFPANQAVGLAVLGIGVVAAASSAILGRRINRAGDIQPLIVTTVSMGVGALVLLVIGLTFQGLPRLTLVHWALIGWLAVVNTAVAFTVWNHSLRTLSAIQSSLINNTMLAQIAILAWLFLGEPLTGQKITGMVLAGIGALLAQLRLGQVRVEARKEQSSDRHPDQVSL
jgi:drug/metabolite transporter (DMT)-like permease